MRMLESLTKTAAILLTAVLLAALLWCNGFIPGDKDFGPWDITDFSSGWYMLDEAGAAVPIAVPGSYGHGDTLTILNTIPTIRDDVYLWLRSSMQDVTVTVDGELRAVYSTENTRPFGKSSASRYIMVRLSPDDTGRSISVTLHTTSFYRGRVNTMSLGSSGALMLQEFEDHKWADAAALCMILLGVLGIIFGVVIKVAYARSAAMLWMGMLGLATGIWKIAESRLRQFYFNNNTIMSSISFLALLLLPLFLFLLLDRVFSRRHRRLFTVLELVALVMLVAEIAIQLCSLYDFGEMLGMTIGTIVCMMLVCLGVLVLEIRSGFAAKHRITAASIGIMLLCCIGEIVLAAVIQRDQILTFIGVLQLFVILVSHELRELIDENTRTYRLARNHAEALSLQIVLALAATVDAKDHYTNGHAVRVAAYAREIAARAGLDEKQQKEIYYTGLLHDIGKVGIPDAVLNKPGQLTPEERGIITQHPALGGEILAKVTEMPELQIGARWHHERYDGTGYPDGLAGDSIPVEARIIAVADCYDAMTSNRSYRKAMDRATAEREIEENAGTQLDPRFAQIMLDMIRDDTVIRLREILPATGNTATER